MRYLILLFTILTFIISTQQQTSFYKQYSSFQPELATQLWRFSKLALCLPKRIQNWNYPKITDLYPGATGIKLFYNNTGDNAGYAFYLPSQNSIFLVFRGTTTFSIKNWIDDINIFFTNYDKCQNCQVHQGFYGSYLSIQKQVISALQLLKGQYSTANVIITGHSLGAAMAIHAASDLSQYTYISTVYTFGLPRVGNDNFQQWFNTQIMGKGQFAARITHYKDPVPHLPLKSWGFIHTDTEVFYNSDSSTFKICQNGGEDSTCSNQFLIDSNISDHLSYMGEAITLQDQLCGFF